MATKVISHTLPVDKHHIIIAKAVVSASWIILNIILIYLSILFLFSTQERLIETITDGFQFYVETVNSYNRIGAFEIIMTLLCVVLCNACQNSQSYGLHFARTAGL